MVTGHALCSHLIEANEFVFSFDCEKNVKYRMQCNSCEFEWTNGYRIGAPAGHFWKCWHPQSSVPFKLAQNWALNIYPNQIMQINNDNIRVWYLNVKLLWFKKLGENETRYVMHIKSVLISFPFSLIIIKIGIRFFFLFFSWWNYD